MDDLENDVRALLGLYPHNNDTNYVKQDGFFYMSICKKYGQEKVDQKIFELKREKR